MSVPIRDEIKPGSHVMIVQKHHQGSGELTEGIVQRVLTRSASHPHGIKVLLVAGQIGRVKKILS
jgi:uncharacterized repeat protein (TIGR03833 family)